MDDIGPQGDPELLLRAPWTTWWPKARAVWQAVWPGVRARLAAHRYTLLLAVLAMALLWPGIARLPPLDREESRTAQATAQMLESGDYVDIRFQEAPNHGQPAGIYWLQAAAVSLLGSPDQRDIWVNRVPGALAAVASVLLTLRIGTVLYGPATGFVAGLLLALSVLLGIEARMATIDAPLLAVILAAQAALLDIWRRRDAPPEGAASLVAPAVFWTAIGAGLLLKGPMILLVCGGTLLGLAVADRRLRWMLALQPRFGIVLALAIVLPWIIGIAGVSGGDFFARSPDDTLPGSLAHAQPTHGLPPGTLLVLFLLTFWPGSLFAARALPWVWANRRAPDTQFLLAWIVPTWVVCEAAMSKAPHDVLPAYPAIAILSAAAICAPGGWWPLRRIGRVLTAAYAGLWVAAGLILALAGPLLLAWLGHRVDALSVLATVVAAILVLHASRQTKRLAPRAALACAGVAALAIALSSSMIALPGLHTIWLSPRIAAAVRSLRPCPDSVLASASYAEPSLVYLVGRDTKLIGPAQAAEFLHEQPACGLALVGARDDTAFADRARALGLTPRALTHIDGIDYPARRSLALTLYTAAPPPRDAGTHAAP